MNEKKSLAFSSRRTSAIICVVETGDSWNQIQMGMEPQEDAYDSIRCLLVLAS